MALGTQEGRRACHLVPKMQQDERFTKLRTARAKLWPYSREFRDHSVDVNVLREPQTQMARSDGETNKGKTAETSQDPLPDLAVFCLSVPRVTSTNKLMCGSPRRSTPPTVYTRASTSSFADDQTHEEFAPPPRRPTDQHLKCSPPNTHAAPQAARGGMSPTTSP